MSIIKELKDRNIINNITNSTKLDEALAKNKAIYIGFDPSFKSLHLGNYVQICLLNRFQKAGIKTYAILGGATGMIGDPSGKKAERNLLDQNILFENISCIKKQISALTNAEIINNYDFYKNISFFDFLREAGKLININYLLEKDIIKSRLETGISFTEFSYNIIQGFDFLTLYKNYDVAIQVGGSDQWGNITTGIEMIRKTIGDNNLACGITINLLTKEDGTKFGKSESGAIYLDKNITSPYEMYQFILNQSDFDLKKLYNFFSFYSIEEIEKILSEHEVDKTKRLGQKKLANEIIDTIHGNGIFQNCEKIANALFYDQFNELNDQELEILFKHFNLFKEKNEILLSELLLKNNIISSKRIFRELLATKGLKINNIIVECDETLNSKKTFFKSFTIIKKGKKNYYVIDWKE